MWGCVAGRTKHVTTWLELLVPPPDLKEGEKGWRVIKSLAIGDSTQSRLCNKASTKRPKGQGSKSSWFGGHVEVWGG